MRRWMEPVFDCVYLIFILALGIVMLIFQTNTIGLLFGVMALVLGIGDVFHLLPRIRMLRTGDANLSAIGRGKWISSITATIYYVLLYYVWSMWYGVESGMMESFVWILLALRVVLCCMPQNGWKNGEHGTRWAILRNIPFTVLGALITLLYLWSGTGPTDPFYLFLPMAVFLSFALYMMVVLFAHKRPALGMLMIPKTLLYVWIQFMGIQATALVVQ